MEEIKDAELHPKEKRNRSKMSEYRNIRINLYLTESELTDYAEESVKVGLRSKSAKIQTIKPHGFNGEMEYNTTGVAKFIRKFLFPAWKKSEAERLIKKRELEKQAKELGMELQ